MSNKYDFIVIGAGPAAINFSRSMAGSKYSVLVVEGDKFGGTCPNYGCEPKIFLEGSVRTSLLGKGLLNRGIKVASEIDWQQLMKKKKSLWKNVPIESEQAFKNLGADTLQGEASFIDNHSLEINGEKYEADKIIIATGRKPNKLKFTGNEFTHNSNDVLDLDYLPKKTTFIGAGVVSLELATMLASAGSEVSIIEATDRPLHLFSKKHVMNTVNEMKQQGIKFYFNEAVSKIVKENNSFKITTNSGLNIFSNYVVDASGRIANISELKLENTNVKISKRGIVTDDHLRTGDENIYAIGDVLDKNQPALVPAAHFEAMYLAKNFRKGDQGPIHYPVIGQSVFAFPQIAQAGVNIDLAKDDPQYKIVEMDNMPTMDMEYAGTNDHSAKLSLVYDKDGYLVGAAESSQTAVDDLNTLIPLIGLKLTRKQIEDHYQLIFPAVGFKTQFLGKQ